jgi:UDPglucose 6-dehydrogenase
MKISIYGVGYVGLVQGAVLADAGHEVMCVNANENKITDLKRDIIPICEPRLPGIVEYRVVF